MSWSGIAWSEDEFRARVTARAAELGETINSLLERAGVLEAFRKTPSSGRRIDTLEKIAQACKWSLAEVMGFSEPLDIDLLIQAYDSSANIVAGLPIWARTTRVRVSAQAYIYAELIDCRQNGIVVDAAHLEACERMLIRAWEQRGNPEAPGSGMPPKRSRTREAPT